jgi:hypothetical protein
MLLRTKGKFIRALLACAFLAASASIAPPASAATGGYHHESTQGEKFQKKHENKRFWKHVMRLIKIHVVKPVQDTADEIVNGPSTTCK